MKSLAVIISVLALCSGCTRTPRVLQWSAGPAADAHSDLEAIHRADCTDWRKVLESPAAAHDLYYSGFVERLKHSQVPTELEAGRQAISVSGTVDARTDWRGKGVVRS